MMAMPYGNVYFASVCLGARDEHTLKSFLEAEAYEGTSLIIAYAHCIEHGIPDMATGMQHQTAMVESGQWLLYRYNPKRAENGEAPLQIDSRAIKTPVEQVMKSEIRFRTATPDQIADAQNDIDERWKLYHYLAGMK